MAAGVEQQDRRTRRMERRRQAILEAAARVFREVGYENAKLEAIGDEVGLSKTSLYYYVKRKEDLLAQILIDVIDTIEADGEAMATPNANPVERLRSLVTSHIRVSCTSPSAHVLGQNLDIILDEGASRRVREARRRYERRIEVLLEEGISSRRLKRLDVRLTTRLLLGSLNSIPRWYPTHEEATPERVADEVLALFMDGLLRRPRPQRTARSGR